MSHPCLVSHTHTGPAGRSSPTALDNGHLQRPQYSTHASFCGKGPTEGAQATLDDGVGLRRCHPNEQDSARGGSNRQSGRCKGSAIGHGVKVARPYGGAVHRCWGDMPSLVWQYPVAGAGAHLEGQGALRAATHHKDGNNVAALSDEGHTWWHPSAGCGDGNVAASLDEGRAGRTIPRYGDTTAACLADQYPCHPNRQT